MKYQVFFIVLFSFLQLNSYAFLQSREIKISENNNNNETLKGQYSIKSGKSTNTVSGTVNIGINKLPKGRIFLLNNNKSNYSVEKNEDIIDGNFQFKNITSGNYILYVIPELNYDFLYFPKYIPTYYGNSHIWQKANNQNINKDNLNLNCNLISFENPFYGDKEISGKLTFRGNAGIENLPIPVILLNESSIPMDFRIIDKHTGKFSFEYLPEGTYTLHPEIPGFKTYDYRFKINNNEQSENNFNFKVDKGDIKIDVESEDIKPIISDKYLKVLLQDNLNYPVICELIDLSGKSIIKKEYYSGEIFINTSGMAANLYILKIKTYDNFPVKTAKVFIRNY